MTGYVLRYVPGTPYGEKFPHERLPWRRPLPTREAAEQLRQACQSTDQLEVLPVEPNGASS